MNEMSKNDNETKKKLTRKRQDELFRKILKYMIDVFE